MNSFSALLDALAAASPERKPVLERLIRDIFERRKSVLALDMSGFTMMVRRDGILNYLCQVRRMQKLTLPLVHLHHGELVKFEADNLLAVFDDPAKAVEAAVAMQRACRQENMSGGPELAFSIGIDHGDLLLLDRVDCFGDPVNLAYKLGEDIARPGEVLITPKVRDLLGPGFPHALREMPISFSGLELLAYSVSTVAERTV